MSNQFVDTGSGIHHYYEYADFTVGNCTLTMHTGKVTGWKFGPDSPIPENASPFQVPLLQEGRAAYLVHDKYWVSAVDFRTMTLDQWNDMLQSMRTQAMQAKLDPLTKGYSQAEISTWSYQSSEARKVIGGGQSTLIEGMAKSRGTTAKDMAQKIIAKSTQYEGALSDVLCSHPAISKIEDAPQVSVLDLVSYTVLLL